MIYVPSYNDYLANNEYRLNDALELSKGQRHLFKSIARIFFINDYGYLTDYGYRNNSEAICQILAGECAPLEANLDAFIRSLSY